MDYANLLVVKKSDGQRYIAKIDYPYSPSVGDLVTFRSGNSIELTGKVERVLFCDPGGDEYAFVSALHTIHPVTGWWQKQHINPITNIQEENNHA